MSSIEGLRNRLDSQFERTQDAIDKIATNVEGISLDDIAAFNSARRQNASASWALNQELTVKHNLAKSIINEIR
ncbi:type III secretion protein HrpF [Marinomonas mediterranea]|jgi:HrpF protein.|uniref:HrpF family protein n=1 Tax=Marinomonas mediterranea (strain ATCC 700492 / JCM 21426 / NBRC 103028 / MMB-1) TaxID=717774 RepID=F2JTC2_MARM1|nr:type III secretion protein HrpF [Marinomonas mediterranea]ADZ90340.1 HrpF family protein [Marinomonas mediterranea MMB-1]WCN08396.1 serine kinase [Marinomonas mediterranea]WCN12452.1 serine kinase [Marinomonas mediterranea]WCN16524.1 serine kinase [Marinomonas mediterranea MMB-1]